MREPTDRSGGVDTAKQDPPERPRRLLNLSQEAYRVERDVIAKYDHLIALTQAFNELKKSEPPPRHYQLEAAAAILESALQYNQGGSINLPVGAGKTRVALDFLRSYNAPIGIISAPSNEILAQFKEHMAVHMPNTRVVSVSSEQQVRDFFADIDSSPSMMFITHSALLTQGALIEQSLHAWSAQHEQKVPIIVDEAHEAIGTQTATAIQSLPGLRIGFSATPTYRYVRPRAFGEEVPDIKSRDPSLPTVEEVFGEELYSLSLIDSVAHGTTPPFAVYGQSFGFEQSNQSIEGELAQTNQEFLTTSAVDLISNQLHNKKVIVVCQNRKQAQQLQTQLSAATSQQSHRDTAILLGFQSDAKRSEALSTVSRSTNGVLIGVEIVRTGIDLPNVDSVVFLGATISTVTIMQAFGRALRHQSAHETTQSNKQLYILRAAHAPGSLRQLVETAMDIPTDEQVENPHPVTITARSGVHSQNKQLRLIANVTAEYARSLRPAEGDEQVVTLGHPEFQIASVLTGSNAAAIHQRQKKLALIIGIALEELKGKAYSGEKLWKLQPNRAGTWQIHLSAPLIDICKKVKDDLTKLGEDPSLVSLLEARDILAMGRSAFTELAHQSQALKRYFVLNEQGHVRVRLIRDEVETIAQQRSQEKELANTHTGISRRELQQRVTFPYHTYLRWVAHKYPNFAYSSKNGYPPKMVKEFERRYEAAHTPPLKTGEYYSEKQLYERAKRDGYWNPHAFLAWIKSHRQPGEMWVVPVPFGGVGNKKVTRYHEQALQRYLDTTFSDQQIRQELKATRDALEPVPDGWVTKKSLQQTFNLYSKRLDAFIDKYVNRLQGVERDRMFRGRVHPAMCVTRTTVAVYLEFQLLTNFGPNARPNNPWAEYLPPEYKDRQVLIDQLKSMGVQMLPEHSRPG